MSQDEKPTMPPGPDDMRALAVALVIGEHDRELEERGVPSGGLLRALAISYGLTSADLDDAWERT